MNGSIEKNIKYLLQQYEDGTFGYFFIDGMNNSDITGAKVVLQQGKDEDREEFITKNHIEFQPNQYGSNLELDKLIHSGEIIAIKEKIIKAKYGLDRLIYHESEWVREEVAKQGYGLDKLVYDKEEWVRREVARQGYGLDELVDDKDWRVRYEVAKKGYGWDKLINDDNTEIIDYIISEISENKDKNQLLKYYENNTSAYARLKLAELLDKTNELVYDENEDNRAYAAKQGYGLDILYKDKSSKVRVAVAQTTDDIEILTKLAKDTDANVRAAICNVSGLFRDYPDMLKLFEDETDDKVLLVLARHHLMLDKMENTKNRDIQEILIKTHNKPEKYMDIPRKSSRQEIVHYFFSNEVDDKYREQVINDNIEIICVYDKSYDRIIEYAISHNLQLDFINEYMDIWLKNKKHL